MANTIQNQVAKVDNTGVQQGKQTVNQMMNAMLDGEKMRSRFDELLGKRAPQFISSVVSLVNADKSSHKRYL